VLGVQPAVRTHNRRSTDDVMENSLGIVPEAFGRADT